MAEVLAPNLSGPIVFIFPSVFLAGAMWLTDFGSSLYGLMELTEPCCISLSVSVSSRRMGEISPAVVFKKRFPRTAISTDGAFLRDRSFPQIYIPTAYLYPPCLSTCSRNGFREGKTAGILIRSAGPFQAGEQS